MNRRRFLGQLVGGLATAAAVRTFPFRVFSFPSAVVRPVYTFSNVHGLVNPEAVWGTSIVEKIWAELHEHDRKLEKYYKKYASLGEDYDTMQKV